MILCVIGIIYASILAFVQTDLKRLVAYSSIAHVGLMCLAIFAQTDAGNNGVIIQMFNHGINITGMWILVAMIEHRYNTRDMRELGGIASVAPTMVIGLVIIAFANIALPLTNAFVGEFMLFHGIFQSANPHHILYMVLAGTGIIMGAVYTLNMVQKVAYGPLKNTMEVTDVRTNELIGLIIIIALVIIVGVYPDIIFGMIG
jgi:NADH-quinone oxidoreductase subunit M